MPGLLGVVSRSAPDRVDARFRAAATRMLRHGGMLLEDASAVDGWWHVGRVRLAHGEGARTVTRSRGHVSFLHGYLHDAEAVAKADGVAQDGATLDDLVSARYRQDREEFVTALDGAFCVSVVDDAHRDVVVATDLFGSYPVYWFVDGEGLVFSSDLSAVIAAMPSRPSLDVRALADYLTLGCVLEDRTLAHGVRLLDPGTVLRYDAERGNVILRRYADVRSFFEPTATDKVQYLEEVCSAFRSAVDRSVLGAAPLGLSLSGGLDSRAILSAVNGRASTVRTYTLGVDGCADHLIAERLSSIAGTRHAFFELDDSYLRDFLPNLAAMVSVTDGMYLSHGLTEMLALRFIDGLGLKVLLRGHGGELAKAHLAWPLHTDPQVHTFRSLEELVPYLSRRANYITPRLSVAELLTSGAARAAGSGSADSFTAVLRDTGLSPAEACSYLYLRELNRRFTVPSLELFRTHLDVRLPYLDRQFLRVLLAAPAEWRDSTEIHKALTRSGIPALAKVRNSNTGAPADAGWVTEAVCDKFNTVFKRLDVRGFRHYHNFEAWMRSMLLQSVEAELLPSSARIQAVIRRDVLAQVIEETRSGAGDHAHLLQVLLIVELWQRENGVEHVAS